MAFKELVREYEKLGEKNVPKKERLHIRSCISGEINSGQIEKEWYMDEEVLNSFAYESNDYENSKSRQPSLKESIISTELLDKKYNELVELLSPKVKSIIRIGSSTWAKNFNVRSFWEDKSDLDLEVIIDDINPSIGAGLPGAEEGLSDFLELYKSGQADYFSYGFKSAEGIPVSIHFMPSKTFERNCNENYALLMGDLKNTEFRTRPKSKPPVYDERYDGLGREFTFKARPKKIKQGFLTEVPVMMLGEQGQIVMGLVMSKYFTFPIVNGDESFFQNQINKFKKNLNTRLFLEGGGSFVNMPARKKLMPDYVLKQLNDEQHKLCQSLFYDSPNVLRKID